MTQADRDAMREIIESMRAERPRYKSHDLGFVDSVSASRVDDWADELETMVLAAEKRDTGIAPDLRGEVIALLQEEVTRHWSQNTYPPLAGREWCQRAEALIARLKAEPPHE